MYTCGRPTDDRTPPPRVACFPVTVIEHMELTTVEKDRWCSRDVVKNALHREAQVDDARRAHTEYHTSHNAERIVLLKSIPV